MKSLLLAELQGVTNASTDTPIQATGGEVYEVNDNDTLYRVHVFKSSGEFLVADAGSVAEVEYLIVAGGGGGGGVIGGGGGAGGFLAGTTTVTAQTYPVIVGAGGLGGFSYNSSVQLGFSGTGSSALGQTAVGGGGGGALGGNDVRYNGSVGGSGGGASGLNNLGAAGTEGQGFSGGAAAGAGSSGNNGGGGGGASSKGIDAINALSGGRGGVGKESDITGTLYWYAGGGGGGSRTSNGPGGIGGSGGGGNGGTTDTSKTSTDGIVNTGGGGGGGGHNGSTAGAVRSGGNGGSGIVVIRYPLQSLQPIQASGGTVSEITENGVTYRVHDFSAAGSGDFTVTDTGSQGRIDYLFVGGGGGGGGCHGGGGGGGGVVLGSMLVETGIYPVVVGSGGAGAVTDTSGTSGDDSGIVIGNSYSVQFDGADDYLELPTTFFNSPPTTFTFEAWIFPLSIKDGSQEYYENAIFSKGATYVNLGITAEGFLQLYHYDGTARFIKGTDNTIKIGQWQHIAVVNVSGTLTFYINGNSVGTGIWYGLHSGHSNTTAWIGGTSDTNGTTIRWFNGFISNFRYTTTAEYTQPFSPSSIPLVDITGTGVLTCQASTIIDSSSVELSVTARGNAKTSMFSPFSAAAIGGGGGGSYGGASTPAGKVGGSGGGGGHAPSVGAAGIPGQGYAGGNGNSNEGAGGGGAGGVGENGGTFGGRGGHGLQVKFLNNEYYFSGGGGGGGWETAAGAGGFGGGGGGGAGAVAVGNHGKGGTGGINPGADGVSGTSGAVSGGAGGQYTGGGGGGSGQRENASYTGVGGNGGSGVAIIRYPIHYPKIIRTTNRSSIYTPGSIVQCVYVRSDNRTFYTGQTTGNGTTIGELALTIKPKRANSILMMKWMINGEVHQDVVFLVHRNCSLIFDGGYEAFNSEIGNQRWSGIVAGRYESNSTNYSTTPNNFMLRYWIPAINTDMRTYAPAVRSSSTAAYTLHLNRVQNTATGTNDQEMTVSSGVIMEIAQ